MAAGSQQPFYHVLVDSRDWLDEEGSPPLLSYVAQELLGGPQVCVRRGGRGGRAVVAAVADLFTLAVTP